MLMSFIRTARYRAHMKTGWGQHLRLIAAHREVDVVGAGLLCVAGEIELWYSLDHSATPAQRVVLTVVVALATLSLAWRRQAPVAVLAAVFGSVALGVAFATSDQGQGPLSLFLAVLLAVFSFGAYARQRRQIVTGATVLSTLFAVDVVHSRLEDAETDIGGWVAVALFWWLGRLFGGRLLRVAQLEQRAEQLEQDREVNARAAVADERARIARELHDVVAHHISMIAVQAETARLATPGMPADGARQLLAIGDTARTALTEMRRLLGVLREDTDRDTTRQPQPGLPQLVELVDDARASASATTRLVVRGCVAPLDPGIELTVYRIVQEALTNARRHAPGAAVDVELDYTAEALLVRVRDNGPGSSGAITANGSSTGGHGLRGMRERAAAVGGDLRVGSAPVGGFTVEATLPAARRATETITG
jgi:signal transduction histidine kinase